MNNYKSTLRRWFEKQQISSEGLKAALEHVRQDNSIYPTSAQWLALVNLMLTWLAGLLLGSGIIFFVAANWQEMSHFSRFALVQSCLLAALALYLFIRRRALSRSDHDGFGYTAANAVLLLICLIIGSLLALVGETYQTGADPWQLFALWAVFILPLALVAGSELLWLLVGILMNVALLLYFDAFPGSGRLIFGTDRVMTGLFTLNLMLHLACLFLGSKFESLSIARWVNKQRFNAPLMQQLSLLLVIGVTTMLAIESLFDWSSGIWLLIYIAVISVSFFVYNHLLNDIFALTLGGFSLVAVGNCMLIRAALEGDDPVGMFLVLGVSIIGSATMVTLWLKQRYKAFNEGGLMDAN
ncbi:hypothetical protein TUM4438_44960 [Shewanella sairae]|uniref:DUF2157 domain-containing protein n=1 Tax=Shewanella sairae TaxID=190310 RepID=A0ABQ4PRP6_9GAMM|nr:DUF2157 domain-containing protein [Shewanella sairae]MCL1131952.1 DUF2157 domain-containing protein [Shewanella sairae]GIU52379.1 hypothetical protein TUM4438_44960 [Shewanella sairae]